MTCRSSSPRRSSLHTFTPTMYSRARAPTAAHAYFSLMLHPYSTPMGQRIGASHPPTFRPPPSPPLVTVNVTRLPPPPPPIPLCLLAIKVTYPSTYALGPSRVSHTTATRPLCVSRAGNIKEEGSGSNEVVVRGVLRSVHCDVVHRAREELGANRRGSSIVVVSNSILI